MKSSVDTNFEPIVIHEPSHIVFSDLDESYLPIDPSQDELTFIRRLEEYFYLRKKLMLIWVTGSSFDQVISKSDKHKVKMLPHFIASSLGTEIWYFDKNKEKWLHDRQWEDRLVNSQYSKAVVSELVLHLDCIGIPLTPQKHNNFSNYKCSYYYFSDNNKMERDLETIKKLALDNGLGVNISYCNPKAHDPENAYDVDFIPINAGKKEIVQFFLNKFNIKPENAFAFGDSGNDIEMLQSVKNGYLLKNATPEAKSRHLNIAKASYAHGILSVLEEYLG